MDFLEKLDFLMQREKINKNTLSQGCGIPYTTIDAFYKKGYQNAKLSTMRKLSEYFDTTLDYLMREEITDPNYGKYDKLNQEQEKLFAVYLALNQTGKSRLLDCAADLNKIQDYKA